MPPIKKISIVIPIYNEEESLFQLIQRTISVCKKLNRDYEILLIDDGSNDNSAHILTHYVKKTENNYVIVILLNRNYGQHPAIMAGFSHVTGDLIITLDADLQNPPEEIIRLVEKADEGYDVIGTIRTNRKDSYFRKCTSRLINWIISCVTGKIMSDYGCMLRAYRRHIVDIMLHCHEHSIFIPILANIFACTITEIPVKHVERKHGKSKYSFIQLINLMYDLITCLTTTPLRILSLFGSIMFFSGFLLFILIGVLHTMFSLHWETKDTVLMFFSVLLIFIGAQFFCISILGEYIGRIYSNVRARPRYFIQRIIRQEQNLSKEEIHL